MTTSGFPLSSEKYLLNLWQADSRPATGTSSGMC